MPRISAVYVRSALFLLWVTALLVFSPEPIQMLLEYAKFIFLGIVGAIFANSTGAGGGVIFVPFFNQIGLAQDSIVATSFAIQCFGMTAGALSWFWFRKQHKASDPEWQDLKSVLIQVTPFSIVGILLVQFLHIQVPSSLHTSFGWFSTVLALAIFATIPLLKSVQFRHAGEPIDRIMFAVIGLAGGAITGWLSVGVGEILAIYMIFRRFNVSFSIACAVIVSAFSVWAGVMHHLFSTHAIYWQILAFAGLGAVIGGSVARHLVMLFSVTKLKIFFASWVLLIGIASLAF